MAHKVSLDSEGFSQVIAKELDLTPQQVSRLADKDVDISSMEEFCCLKMKELDKLFPGLNIKQKKCFRMLKKRFEREPPPAGARSPPKVCTYVQKVLSPLLLFSVWKGVGRTIIITINLLQIL